MAGHKVAQKEYETNESGVGVIAEQSKQFKYIVNWLVEVGKEGSKRTYIERVVCVLSDSDANSSHYKKND